MAVRGCRQGTFRRSQWGRGYRGMDARTVKWMYGNYIPYSIGYCPVLKTACGSRVEADKNEEKELKGKGPGGGSTKRTDGIAAELCSVCAVLMAFAIWRP